MNTKDWRTTLGGSLSATGKVLMGVGLLGELSNNAPPNSKAILWWIALAGFIISAFGSFFAGLFATDKTQ